MKRFALAALVVCALVLSAFALAEEPAANLVSCEYAIFGGMENENITYTIRLDDVPDAALLTAAENGRFQAYAVPRQALDDFAALMAAYNPAGWASLPDREEYALDAPVRVIALVYEDGTEYTLTNDQDVDGPVFADAERLFTRWMGGDAEMSRIAGTYRYENDGFGGEFTITLNADGTYTFYEGALSSYMGGGLWSADGDAVRMTEQAGFDLAFVFGVEDGALIYRAEESDAFPYVKVSDGERFARMDAAAESD